MIDQAAELKLLLDERTVIRVLDQWSLAMDQMDWPGVEACLDDEFTLLVPPIVAYAEPLPRAQAVAEIAKRNGSTGGSFHCMPDKQVAIDGDQANVRSRLIGGHWSQDKAAWDISYGLYDLNLVRRREGWKLRKLSLNILFSHGPGIYDQMST